MLCSIEKLHFLTTQCQIKKKICNKKGNYDLDFFKLLYQ